MAPTTVDDLTFEQIVSAHYESLYRFALSLTQREGEAADLTQETFYRWGAKGNQLRDRSKAKTWLFTTLYRTFLGSRRREMRFPHYEIEAADNELPAVTPNIVSEMDAATVMEALLEIDELYRGPLTLFYLEDHSYREIAEILEVPTGTVMSRLARGKTQLREKLFGKSSGLQSKVVSIADLSTSARKHHE